jgi:hypothetical protein
MLQISKNQFEILAQNQEKNFYNRLALQLKSYIKQEYPGKSDDQIDQQVNEILNITNRWDLVTEKQITELSFILTAFPDNFEKKERFNWMVQILSGNMNPSKKIKQIQSIIKAS